MTRGSHIGRDEQKEMLLNELRCRGYWFFNWETQSMQKAGAGEPREPAPYEMPPANGECLIFTRLPAEIRAIIFRILFVRSSKVVPGPVRYDMKICYRNTKLNIYSYVWNGCRQRMYSEFGLPTYNGLPQHVTKEWVTKATDAQLALIKNGVMEKDYNEYCKLPKTFDEELGEWVEHYVCHRGPYPTKIVNQEIVCTTGIFGVNMLATCKKFRDEGASILYGGNHFVVDTRGQDPFTHHRGVHEFGALDEYRYLVPGIPNEDGTSQTHRQTLNAISRMFDYKSMHQRFMCRDPLARFFRAIGRKNASHITSIRIEGFFKTAENHLKYRDNRPITFARILPIHATILAHACRKLTKLAIYQGPNNDLWEDDLEGRFKLSDEDRYDEVIGKVVNKLPGLQSLELANYSFEEPKEHELGQDPGDIMTLPWGKALRWEAIVENRYRQRKIEQREKEEREAKRLEVDQYIWREERILYRGGRGRGRGDNMSQGERAESSSTVARYNASFAALVENAAGVAGDSDAGSSTARPSFKRGKKLARGGFRRGD
ncbi:hypothetical protein N431DRAFT_469832 [Stipitochalara longipes BDJ]|nr:hypothetical protein N431DRAFT_469832 [Stipitochalara longipes BDJ]